MIMNNENKNSVSDFELIKESLAIILMAGFGNVVDKDETRTAYSAIAQRVLAVAIRQAVKEGTIALFGEAKAQIAGFVMGVINEAIDPVYAELQKELAPNAPETHTARVFKVGDKVVASGMQYVNAHRRYYHGANESLERDISNNVVFTILSMYGGDAIRTNDPHSTHDYWFHPLELRHADEVTPATTHNAAPGTH